MPGALPLPGEEQPQSRYVPELLRFSPGWRFETSQLMMLPRFSVNIATLVRTLMYAGFEMVHPSVLPDADPKYLVLGMDI